MRDRRIMAALLAGGAFIAVIAHRPSADIRLLTHDAADPTPHRIQAAFDLGLVAVSVLYTWTGKRIG